MKSMVIALIALMATSSAFAQETIVSQAELAPVPALVNSEVIVDQNTFGAVGTFTNGSLPEVVIQPGLELPIAEAPTSTVAIGLSPTYPEYQPNLSYPANPSTTSYTSPPATSYPSVQSQTQTGQGVAQRKAAQAAQSNIRGHVGGGLGGARYEGVGWSNVSAQSAIEHCCYWGTRPVAEIGVAKGNDGCWYACVLYQ